ncbi:hypothetical protein PPACK8108_LOCUS619 [Phakopsora pachyrhizi]|uniref:Uncharacterized protein n=1 Tax=Phakopsora pachyrhizi TaxID=170000 RepID=A0AAV0AHV5_PHAPC|nr:hypothetical protein PPACK8108_LOCUS619 [Phakopsora pachyrhizi]
MEITNHKMGETCVLTFKPRGWRGKDANKVKESIFDQKARRAGSATGELAPDQLQPPPQAVIAAVEEQRVTGQHSIQPDYFCNQPEQHQQ